MRQITFACQPSFEQCAKQSRRELFLNTMESVVPWAELEALIEPHYRRADKGRQSVGLSIMLRIYLLQHWFSLSDPGTEDALRESPVLRGFAGVDLGRAAAQDMTCRRVKNAKGAVDEQEKLTRGQDRSAKAHTGTDAHRHQRSAYDPETARTGGKLLRPERCMLCRLIACLPCRRNNLGGQTGNTPSLLTSNSRIAGCRAACPVVWQGRRGNSPYADHLSFSHFTLLLSFRPPRKSFHSFSCKSIK